MAYSSGEFIADASDHVLAETVRDVAALDAKKRDKERTQDPIAGGAIGRSRPRCSAYYCLARASSCGTSHTRSHRCSERLMRRPRSFGDGNVLRLGLRLSFLVRPWYWSLLVLSTGAALLQLPLALWVSLLQ